MLSVVNLCPFPLLFGNISANDFHASLLFSNVHSSLCFDGGNLPILESRVSRGLLILSILMNYDQPVSNSERRTV
jgi:hypothetical protein